MIKIKNKLRDLFILIILIIYILFVRKIFEIEKGAVREIRKFHDHTPQVMTHTNES